MVALHAREERAVEVLRELLAAEHESAARPAERLVRGRGHDVGMRHRIRVRPGRHQTGDVRHVDHEEGPDGASHRGDPLEVDHARVGARAHHDHLGLVRVRETLELLVVDPQIGRAHV